ncbi:hypothetical protein M9H77_07551 [Catharanthus roseus]|uniref:Uncharacterized protein n=1 Tax=Catharanthus roseus TaxID=4058 RepID=A0ACC0BVI3_CATRO|nr:hypothetical protein M9H77_07551 [Catharanthus roseus]
MVESRAGNQPVIAKDRVDSVDEVNKRIAFELIGGEVTNYFKSFKATLEASENGNANIVKWTLEYEKANEDVPTPNSHLDFLLSVSKEKKTPASLIFLFLPITDDQLTTDGSSASSSSCAAICCLFSGTMTEGANGGTVIGNRFSILPEVIINRCFSYNSIASRPIKLLLSLPLKQGKHSDKEHDGRHSKRCRIRRIGIRDGGTGTKETFRWVHFLHQVSSEEGGGGVAQALYGEKQGEYVEFTSKEFWERFHVKRKAEEEATAMGTTVPDDLALIVIVWGGVSRRRVYRARSERAHLKAGSSRALFYRGLALIGPCCAYMLRRVEAVSRYGYQHLDIFMPAPTADSEIHALGINDSPPVILGLIRMIIFGFEDEFFTKELKCQSVEDLMLGSGARIEGEGVEEEQTGIVGAGSSKSTAGAVDDDGGA